MKVILLTSKKAGMPARPVSLAHVPDELSLTTSDLSPKATHDARNDPKVLGVAPPMPTYLIHGAESVDQPTPTVSWGVEAVDSPRRAPWTARVHGGRCDSRCTRHGDRQEPSRIRGEYHSYQ